MRKIPCPIGHEELRQLVEVEKLTDKQIADRLDGGTPKRVMAWRKRAGISQVPSWSRLGLSPLEGQRLSLLAGSMLGDGRLVGLPNSAYFVESHSGKQREYLNWKVGLWGDWVSRIRDVPDKRGFTQVRLYTHSHADLTPWHQMFYPSGKGWKTLDADVVDYVDSLAMAVWYMDDGTSGWWPSISFGMGGDSNRIAQAIFAKHSLTPVWDSEGVVGNFIFRGDHQANRFLDLIRPHIPPCMQYKLNSGYKNSTFREVQGRKDLSKLQLWCSQGVPLSQMGQALGVGGDTVKKWILDHGIEYTPTVGRPSTSIPKLVQRQGLAYTRPTRRVRPTVEEARFLFDAGVTDHQIAEQFSVHIGTVRRRLKASGLGPRKTGPRPKHAGELTDPNITEDRALQILLALPLPVLPKVDIGVALKKLQGSVGRLTDEGEIRPASLFGIKACYPYFPNRYHARYKGRPSAAEQWGNPKALRQAIRFQLKYGDPITPDRVLKAICANARTPTNFRPAAAKFIYERFCKEGDQVWDPCAGFGGRLLGAVAAGVQYYGTDVSPETIAGCGCLAVDLGVQEMVTVVNSPAENADPPKGCALVFTSPPYFAQERYRGGKQSHTSYTNYQDWLDGFLHPLCRRAWDCLVDGGHLALNVADIRNRGVCYPLSDDTIKSAVKAGFSHVETLRYPIASLGAKRQGWEPVLVFRK